MPALKVTAGAPTTEGVQGEESAFCARSIRNAAFITWGVALVSAVYVALTWDGANRSLLLAIAGAASVEAALILRYVRPLLRSDEACERCMFIWATLHVGVIAWLCVLDGGMASPFVAIFLVSVAFAGGALPRRRVLTLAAINAAAVLAVAVLGPDHGRFQAEAVVWGGALLIIAGVCVTIAEHRALRGAELTAAREELPRRLARVVEYRDDDTGGHIERMAGYAELIAGALGVSASERRRIRLASAMHDIGKVAVPDAVLLKPGALTAEERAVMQTHARVGFEMLSGSGSDLLDLAATIALTHHERYDGGGYPQGLRGEDIPLPGRIVAVADVFDALTSKRVYKDAMPTERAIEVIREGRGTQFDPRVVDAFDRAIAASVHSPAERPLAPASEAEVPDDRRAAGPGEAAGTREGRPGVLGDARRLAALRELAILDTPAESDFDDVARLAAAVCRSPVAAVNFVDGERHFTKAVVGMPEALGGSVRNDLSFCAATVQSRDGVLAIPDTRTDDHWRDHPMVAGGPGLGFYMGASIHSAGERVGVVCAFGTEPRTVTAQDREALVTLARQVERHLEVRRRNTELRDLALTDPLTGLANRTLLYDRLQHALAHRSRVGRGVGVLYCDVDDFKGINDRLGHEEGDALLCDIAATLRSVARASDTVARIAGDEFVIVCPHVDHQSDLDTVRTRLEEAIAWQRPLRDGSPPPRVSVGAVLADPGDSAADILRRADHAMYGAKRRTHRVAVV